MSILIVDDDEEYLAYMGLTLKGAGHEPVLISSSAEACRLIEARDFALIVTDLVMPFRTGFDVLKAAREKNPLTVGIITTAFGSYDTAMDAVRNGVYDFLFKPSTQDVVKAAVRRALEYYELRQTVLEQAVKIDSLKKSCLTSVNLVQKVSHALRNPLTVVYGVSTYLARQGLANCKPEEFQQSLDSITRNVERMATMLEKFEAAT